MFSPVIIKRQILDRVICGLTKEKQSHRILQQTTNNTPHNQLRYLSDILYVYLTTTYIILTVLTDHLTYNNLDHLILLLSFFYIQLIVRTLKMVYRIKNRLHIVKLSFWSIKLKYLGVIYTVNPDRLWYFAWFRCVMLRGNKFWF
jgi:hypothetical protein